MKRDMSRSFGFLHINEREGKPRLTAVAGERWPRARLDSVVKSVRNLERISVRNLTMHLV